MSTFFLFWVFTGAAIIHLSLAVYAWQHRNLPGAKMFSLAAILYMVWPLTQAIDLTTSDLSLKIFLMRSHLDAPVFGGIASLIMFAQLTGQANLINRRYLAIICSVPLAALFLNLAGHDELIRHSYYLENNGAFSILQWSNGPLFWIWFAWSYLVVAGPFFILASIYKNISTASAQQGRFILLALLLPMIVNLLFQFGITPINGINIASVAISISSMFIAWTIFQYELPNIVPIARGLLIENMDDGVLVIDNHNNVVDINPAMLKLIGMNTDAAIGENIETIFAPWPDILLTFRDVNDAQTEISIDGRSKRYFDLHISPLYGTGRQEAGRIVVVRNVTKYKQVENQLILQSTALNAAANAVVITDTNDVIQWVNPAFTRLTGYSETEAIGKTPRIISSGKHEPDFYRSMHEIPRDGQAWKGEVINKHKNGTEYFEEQTITPVYNRDGRISHFIAIKEDITSRKQAEMARINAEAELKTAFKRTNILFDVTRTGITSQSISTLLQVVVEKVARDLPANRASLIIFDEISKRIDHFVRGGIDADQVILSVNFDELMEGLSGWAIRTGRSALSLKDVPDPRESEAVRRRRQETNCGSIIVTPLKYQNNILGTLTLINLPEEPDFTEQDVELIEAVAGQISSAIVKVGLEESLQHQNKYLTTLHQITLDLLNKVNITELLQSIVDRAAEFLDAPYCEIMLHENDKLVVRAYTSNQSFLANDQVERGEASLSWDAFDSRAPAIVNDYSNWSQRRSIYNEFNISAVISLPILSKDGSIGVLDISRSKPDMEFDDFEIQAATLFAQLASLALENAKLHETIREEAIQDPLTRLFNRRFMWEALGKEISRAKRKGASLAIVMFDLDHLKEINDIYGHSAGDDVLQAISNVIKTKVRSGDIACRYGGDEFTLILADATMDNAKQRMEELRKEISLMSIQHQESLITKFSLSIGIAEYPRNGITGEDLLKAADMALYRAKQAGRDQVMTA